MRDLQNADLIKISGGHVKKTYASKDGSVQIFDVDNGEEYNFYIQNKHQYSFTSSSATVYGIPRPEVMTTKGYSNGSFSISGQKTETGARFTVINNF